MNLLRALLVSQDDAARRDVAQLLSDYSFDCVQAADGIAALHFASRDGIDLIVTDVRLLKMDGPQFLDIVTDGAFGAKPPPVIMCASFLHEQAWVRKLVMPRVTLLSRPFTADAFAVALDAAFPAE